MEGRERAGEKAIAEQSRAGEGSNTFICSVFHLVAKTCNAETHSCPQSSQTARHAKGQQWDRGQQRSLVVPTYLPWRKEEG